MAGPRARSSSVRRARGLSIGEDGKPVPLKRWDGASKTCRDWDELRRVSRIGPMETPVPCANGVLTAV